MYYDRDGNSITRDEWSKLFEDETYRRVAATTVHKRWWVSTVWLGLDHGFMSERPMAFETCIFDDQKSALGEQVQDIIRGVSPDSWVVRRYPTWDAAKRGHRQIVKQLREGVMPADI